MENVKKAIILDMDETLEHGFAEENGQIMTLRPKLDELIEKLKEAKEQSIDVILCTTAKQRWVDRFLNLKPEFRTVFDRMLTRDNEEEWKNYSQEDYPLEYKVKSEEMDIENGKPITTFGYNSVLFIDDSTAEAYRLKKLFDITQGKLQADVTFFSGFGYWTPDVSEIFSFIEAGKKDEETAAMVTEYLQSLRDENGCLMMCSVIDDFMQKEYEPGLTVVDDKYKEKYQEHKAITNELSGTIEERMFDLEDELGVDFLSLTYKDSEVKERYNNFFTTDKHYPYEGIEMLPQNTKEEILGVVDGVKLSSVEEAIKETKEGLQTDEKKLEEVDENEKD